MRSRLQALVVLGTCTVTIPAAADESPTNDAQSGQTGASAGSEPANSTSGTLKPSGPKAASVAKSDGDGLLEGWQSSVNGYFRAPMALGLSVRQNPNDTTGPQRLQVSYGPNRVLDASYYSFAYTRLQEQDWAEMTFHEKKKHVDIGIGWMGYWYQAAGYRNPDAAWIPGIAYVALDTDFNVGGIKPNIQLTAGSWWPKFGTFEQYDTYTLGRFRQLGEQLQLTVPINADMTVTAIQGFGTARDGSYQFQGINPLYQSQTAIDLITWENLAFSYKNELDIGLHYNNEWTSDPNVWSEFNCDGQKCYSSAAQSHLTVVGGEASVKLPVVGRLWVSPSYIQVRNGWALGNGTEVMHGLGGVGVASNYLGWANSLADSTGSGSIFNLGVLYQNSLSNVRGLIPGSLLPDVALEVFGLYSTSNMDLPAGSVVAKTTTGLTSFKWGADASLQALTWLGLMARYDSVDLSTGMPGYVFSAISGRATLTSHFLSGESIYLQYSHYIYGDNMKLAGTWPWSGQAAVEAGNNNIQDQSGYSQKTPDEDVLRLQASVAF